MLARIGRAQDLIQGRRVHRERACAGVAQAPIECLRAALARERLGAFEMKGHRAGDRLPIEQDDRAADVCGGDRSIRRVGQRRDPGSQATFWRRRRPAIRRNMQHAWRLSEQHRERAASLPSMPQLNRLQPHVADAHRVKFVDRPAHRALVVC